MEKKFWKTIEEFTTHWSRNSDDSLTLWFSGYSPAEMYECESKMLKEHNFICIKSEFDKICGKTAMTIRKKGVSYQVLVLEKNGMHLVSRESGLTEAEAKTAFQKAINKYDSKFVKQLVKDGSVISNIAC